ncbi:hypothetical protein D9M72_536750 [compost metagenome]
MSNKAEGDVRTLYPLQVALALSRMGSEPVKTPPKESAPQAEALPAEPRVVTEAAA